jgi:hypothetical protein
LAQSCKSSITKKQTLTASQIFHNPTWSQYGRPALPSSSTKLHYFSFRRSQLLEERYLLQAQNYITFLSAAPNYWRSVTSFVRSQASAACPSG